MPIEQVVRSGTFRIIDQNENYLGLLLFSANAPDLKVNSAELKVPHNSPFLRLMHAEDRHHDVHYFNNGQYTLSDIWSYHHENPSNTNVNLLSLFKEYKGVGIPNFKIPQSVKDAFQGLDEDKLLIEQLIGNYLE